jgi:hypothetical protein
LLLLAASSIRDISSGDKIAFGRLNAFARVKTCH